ncbi:MAG: hypothetical protein MK096_06370 [Oleiphilaceae bacterium]|nr:hypothetical protein [Oleiphilaceae bacterium]
MKRKTRNVDEVHEDKAQLTGIPQLIGSRTEIVRFKNRNNNPKDNCDGTEPYIAENRKFRRGRASKKAVVYRVFRSDRCVYVILYTALLIEIIRLGAQIYLAISNTGIAS